MIDGFEIEMAARGRRDNAMRRAERERLAATCAAARPTERSGSVTTAARRRLVPRLIGFVPVVRARGAEWV